MRARLAYHVFHELTLLRNLLSARGQRVCVYVAQDATNEDMTLILPFTDTTHVLSAGTFLSDTNLQFISYSFGEPHLQQCE